MRCENISPHFHSESDSGFEPACLIFNTIYWWKWKNKQKSHLVVKPGNFPGGEVACSHEFCAFHQLSCWCCDHGGLIYPRSPRDFRFINCQFNSCKLISLLNDFTKCKIYIFMHCTRCHKYLCTLLKSNYYLKIVENRCSFTHILTFFIRHTSLILKWICLFLPFLFSISLNIFDCVSWNHLKLKISFNHSLCELNRSLAEI